MGSTEFQWSKGGQKQAFLMAACDLVYVKKTGSVLLAISAAPVAAATPVKSKNCPAYKVNECMKTVI